MQTISLGAPDKNHFSAGRRSGNPRALLRKAARPQRLGGGHIKSIQFKIAARLTILVVVPGAQEYVAEKGQVIVFIDLPPLRLLRHRAEYTHFAVALFELRKIHKEISARRVICILKRANVKNSSVRIEIPHTAARTARHSQPFQVRRCGKGAQDAQLSKRQLQRDVGRRVCHLIDAYLPVQSFANG